MILAEEVDEEETVDPHRTRTHPLDELAHVGLALATGLSACLNAGLLWRGLRRLGVYRARAGWGVLFLRIVLACAAMAAVLVWAAGDTAWWLRADAAERAGRLALCVGAGTLAYFVALAVAGLRPAQLRPSL